MDAITRRDFLGKMIAAFTLFAGCSLKKTMWPAVGSDKGSVRLIFYTDVHARTEWQTPMAMSLAVDAINGQKADLVIAGGDLITDGFQSSASKVAPRWNAYMKMQQAIESDVYPAIGNHDLVAAIPEDGSPAAENPRSIYLGHMGLDRTYFSFNSVGYHFIILDAIHVTGDEYEYQGIIWPEQLEWLRRDLSSIPRGTPVVVVSHIPLLSASFSERYGTAYAALPNRVIVNHRDIFKAFENHNVILVLQGHLHIKEMIRRQNTTFITGGAICGKWWRGAWYGTAEGFNIITLTGNHVAWEYIDYGWEARRPPNK